MQVCFILFKLSKLVFVIKSSHVQSYNLNKQCFNNRKIRNVLLHLAFMVTINDQLALIVAKIHITNTYNTANLAKVCLNILCLLIKLCKISSYTINVRDIIKHTFNFRRRNVYYNINTML